MILEERCYVVYGNDFKPLKITYKEIFHIKECGGGNITVLEEATVENGIIELKLSEHVHYYGGVDFKGEGYEYLDMSKISVDSRECLDSNHTQEFNRFKTCQIETNDGLILVYDGFMRCIFMYDRDGTFIRAFGEECNLFDPILFFQHTDESIFILNNNQELSGDYSDRTLKTERNLIQFFIH
jgi:hypothetical protein